MSRFMKFISFFSRLQSCVPSSSVKVADAGSIIILKTPEDRAREQGPTPHSRNEVQQVEPGLRRPLVSAFSAAMADTYGRLEAENNEFTGPVFARSDSDEFGDALLDALGSESCDDDGDDSPDTDPPSEAAPSHSPAPNVEAPSLFKPKATPPPPRPAENRPELTDTSPRRPGSSRRQVLRPASSQLEGLPPEVLWRVLSFLSADDLATCAAVSHNMRSAAAGEAPGADHLWRRLWCARWGRSTEEPAIDLRRAYFVRDGQEVADLRQRVPPDLHPFYLQMTQSRRCECLGRRHVEASAAEAPQQPPAVAEWLRRRGFGGAPASGAIHRCEGATWSRVGVALLCDRCGFAHMCDDMCKERILDGDHYVCPISGYSSARLVNEWEEATAAAKAEDLIDDGPEPGGRLARAYTDGYNCKDERELRRVCYAML